MGPQYHGSNGYEADLLLDYQAPLPPVKAASQIVLFE
jgi:hypothetical protein